MRLLCKLPKTLNDFLEHIIGNSGEGIILRMPKSIYQHGRSSLLWKVKVSTYIHSIRLLVMHIFFNNKN